MDDPNRSTREELTSDGQTEQQGPFKRPRSKKQKKKAKGEADKQLEIDTDSQYSQEGTTGGTASSSRGRRRAADHQDGAHNESILTRIAKHDKIISTALGNISIITGQNEEATVELDNIITAVSKLKAIALEVDYNHQFLRGKIETTEEQLECGARPSYAAVDAETPKEEEQQKTQKSKAIIISAKDRRPQQIIQLIKKTVDPVGLGIKDTSIRPGKDGVIVASTDASSLEKLANHIQGAQEFQGMEIKQA